MARARDGRLVLAPGAPFGSLFTVTVFDDPRVLVDGRGRPTARRRLHPHRAGRGWRIEAAGCRRLSARTACSAGRAPAGSPAGGCGGAASAAAGRRGRPPPTSSPPSCSPGARRGSVPRPARRASLPLSTTMCQGSVSVKSHCTISGVGRGVAMVDGHRHVVEHPAHQLRVGARRRRSSRRSRWSATSSSERRTRSATGSVQREWGWRAGSPAVLSPIVRSLVSIDLKPSAPISSSVKPKHSV